MNKSFTIFEINLGLAVQPSGRESSFLAHTQGLSLSIPQKIKIEPKKLVTGQEPNKEDNRQNKLFTRVRPKL